MLNADSIEVQNFKPTNSKVLVKSKKLIFVAKQHPKSKNVKISLFNTLIKFLQSTEKNLKFYLSIP